MIPMLERQRPTFRLLRRAPFVVAATVTWLWVAALVPTALAAQVADPEVAEEELPAPRGDEPAGTVRGLERGDVSAEGEVDVVRLKDLSTFRGRVVELGGNTIRVEYRGGSKEIPKGEIGEVSFWEGRQASERPNTDVVVLKDTGHQVRGKVRETATSVEVTLPNGARVVYDRTRVQRVVYKDEVIQTTARFYTAELGEQIDQALAAILRATDPEAIKSHEDFLVESGIFAIAKVRSARASLTAEQLDRPGARSIDRVIRTYRLKEIVSSELQAAEPEVYEDLARGSEAAKESLLKFLFPRFPDDAAALALELIPDDRESVRVRSIAVEMLRRMERNRDLVDLYNAYAKKSPQLSFIAAVALARNRIFFGVPTLIDALGLGGDGDEDVRDVAAGVLREATGQDFGFHAQRAAERRAEAIAKWREWWADNREQLIQQSYLVLEKKAVVSEERKQALDLWRAAYQFLEDGKQEQAETYLRRSMQADPSFVKATVSLAVALMTHPGAPPTLEGELDEVQEAQREKLRRARVEEAERILVGLTGRVLVDADTSDRHRIHVELANLQLMQGRPADALDQYELALALDPASVNAVVGVADCHWDLAVGRNELSRGERRIEAQAALTSYERAQEMLRERLRSIRVLGIDDLPSVDSLPFRRREHNRNALGLRREHETRLIRLFMRKAQCHTFKGDREAAARELKEGIDSLAASFELKEATELEIELRAFLGKTYESLGEGSLAAEQYVKVLRDLDPEHDVCRRGIARLRRQSGERSEPERREPSVSRN